MVRTYREIAIEQKASVHQFDHHVCRITLKATVELLYGLLILKHGRREILCLAATANPSAEWITRQLMGAYGWEQEPVAMAM
jgi:hypothetical protein